MPTRVTIRDTLTSNDFVSGKRVVIILVENPAGFAREITVLGTPIDVDLEIQGVHQCNARGVLLTREQALDLGTILLTPVVPALNIRPRRERCPEECAYQTRTTILTSQLPVARWHEQINDPPPLTVLSINSFITHIASR